MSFHDAQTSLFFKKKLLLEAGTIGKHLVESKAWLSTEATQSELEVRDEHLLLIISLLETIIQVRAKIVGILMGINQYIL